MTKYDGHASKEAKEFSDNMALANQLRTIASSSSPFFAEHITKAISAAAEAIEKLILKPIDTSKK
jgi:hypothetical protein